MVLEYARKDKSEINLQKYLTQADDSKQSGDQSKSDLINETENDEEMHIQKVCRVITIVLKDNNDWKRFVTNVLDPILELEKGKLCQQEERDQNSNSSNFDNNIFDDDFINGGAENNATD
jgi:rubrerythrin